MAAIANPAPALAAKSPAPPPRSNSNGHEQAPVISDDTVQGIVAALNRALAQLGFQYVPKEGGDPARVCWLGGYIDDCRVALGVDVGNLPYGVTVQALSAAADELAARCGYPVSAHRVNVHDYMQAQRAKAKGRPAPPVRQGLTYLVSVIPDPALTPANLPRRVNFRVAFADGIIGSPGVYIPVGMGAHGPEWQSLDKLLHLLVVGISGSGKSSWIQCALCWLMMAYRPSDIRLLIVDAKNPSESDEYAMWDGAPHLLRPVAYAIPDILEAFSQISAEAEARMSLFKSVKTLSITDYTRVSGEPLPRILVVLDEVLALSLRMTKTEFARLMKQLGELAFTCRKTGIHLLFGAQDIKAKDIDKAIVDQFDDRIGFRLPDAGVTARLKLKGAELIPKDLGGRAITNIGGALHPVQGFWMSEDYRRRVAQQLTTQAGPPRPRRTLSADEYAWCLYARDKLGGRFAIKAISAHEGVEADGVNWSHRQIGATAKVWREQGKLVLESGDKARGYRMGEELLAILSADEALAAEGIPAPRPR